MIQKEKKLVYDKETDTLKLNAIENLLITDLMRNPPVNYEMILTNYYNESDNKVEFVERLNEILLFYWNAPHNNPVTPFTYNRGGLENLIGMVNTLREAKSKPKSSKPKGRKLNLLYILGTAGKVKKFKELVKRKVEADINKKYDVMKDFAYLLINLNITRNSKPAAVKPITDLLECEFGKKLKIKGDSIRKNFDYTNHNNFLNSTIESDFKKMLE